MGGDRRSGALVAHAPGILGWLEEKPGLFLREIVARLAGTGNETSAMRVARLRIRHGIARKKRLWSRPRKRARTLPGPAPSGATG
jgi:hypothetical protein